jgi:hypothetical protein
LSHCSPGCNVAPSTWAVLPDRLQPVIGAKTLGIVEHLFDQDGSVTSTLVRIEGLRHATVGDDLPSPYDDH